MAAAIFRTHREASSDHLDVFESVQVTPTASMGLHSSAIDQLRPLDDFYLSSGFSGLLPLKGRYVRGHDQTGGLVQLLSGQANRDRKVSRSCGDNSSLGVSRPKDCSSKLERAAMLNGLVFDEDCSPSQCVQRGARSYGCFQRPPCNKLEIITNQMNRTGHLGLCGNRKECRGLSDTPARVSNQLL